MGTMGQRSGAGRLRALEITVGHGSALDIDK
jgi:hypothetical protein